MPGAEPSDLSEDAPDSCVPLETDSTGLVYNLTNTVYDDVISVDICAGQEYKFKVVLNDGTYRLDLNNETFFDGGEGVGTNTITFTVPPAPSAAPSADGGTAGVADCFSELVSASKTEESCDSCCGAKSSASVFTI